jgi:sarcosine oxidase
MAYDVVLVGGGVVGSSIAYFLASNTSFDGSILVVEKDRGYSRCSTGLSAGGLRQQFSTPENIKLSQFGAHFLKHLPEYLQVDDQPPDAFFVQGGYLFLATQEGLLTLKENLAIQQTIVDDLVFLDPHQLKQRFPWLNVTDLAAGTLGLANEGWLDANSLMQALIAKAKSLGVTFIEDEVVDLQREGNSIVSVMLKHGEPIKVGTLVNAAGPAAAGIAAMAGVNLPVRCRKRCVFQFNTESPVSGLPMLIDPSGVYVRPEGDSYICGVSPPADQDPDCGDFIIDDALFEETIWPTLANRVPLFERLRQVGSWAGHYAYNIHDQNAIVGFHPVVKNLMFANGFSGHGLQQAPGVGRAVAELIGQGSFQSIDLSRFAFERFERGELLFEKNVV